MDIKNYPDIMKEAVSKVAGYARFKDLAGTLPCLTEEIDGEEVTAVDARTLHEQLGVKGDFSAWLKHQIERHEFTKGVEIIGYNIHENSGISKTAGQPRKDYLIEITAAKHIALATMTEKGKDVRAYFIAIEKAAKKVVMRLIGEIINLRQENAELKDLLIGQSRRVDELIVLNNELATILRDVTPVLKAIAEKELAATSKKRPVAEGYLLASEIAKNCDPVTNANTVNQALNWLGFMRPSKKKYIGWECTSKGLEYCQDSPASPGTGVYVWNDEAVDKIHTALADMNFRKWLLRKKRRKAQAKARAAAKKMRRARKSRPDYIKPVNPKENKDS